MSYILKRSNRKDKKICVITPSGKKIHFGAYGYSDFTEHKDKERKERYLKRHHKNENWNNLNTAGAWSRWLLWEKPTLRSAIRNMEQIFNISIII